MDVLLPTGLEELFRFRLHSNKNRLCSKTCGINKILLLRKNNKKRHLSPFPKRIYEAKNKLKEKPRSTPPKIKKNQRETEGMGEQPGSHPEVNL